MTDKFSNANPQYRDSVFRDFFNDKVRLLSLCNALLNTDYQDPNLIEINTLEGNQTSIKMFLPERIQHFGR